jgi:fucose permease
MEHLDERQDEPSENVARRRSSVTSIRAGLTFKDLPSSIPEPLPESLPTTPGFELPQEIFESFLGSSSQQRPQIPRNPTATTLTKLVEYGEEIPDDLVMSIKNPPKNLFRVIAGCLWVFSLGLSDGVLGAILPNIEVYYHISYAIVSLIWLGNAIGFIIVAFTAHLIDNALGMQKSLTLSVACFIVMHSLTSSGTIFAVIVVAFFFGGLGGAIGLSQYNIFLSKLKNGAHYLGIFHGSYGVGAFLAPLIGTALVNGKVKWNFYYFIPLSLVIINVVFTPWAFNNCHEDLKKFDQIETGETGEIDRTDVDIELDDLGKQDSGQATQEVGKSEKKEEKKHDFKAAFKDHRPWLICFFIFFYQGSEVSFGGWTVTFLLEYRDGNPNSTGYIASGFWGGVMLGRFLLTTILSRTCGVRRGIIVLMLMIMVLDFCVWFIPNTIAAGVCVSIIGLLIGPIYPLMISLITRILPRKIRFCSMTLATAFGSSGGSAIPFAVGMGSQFVGTYILHPIVLVCYAGMMITWVLLPNIERKGAQTSLWQKIW